MRRSQLHHHTHWWRNLFITIIVIGVLGYGGYRLFYYSEGINRPQQTTVSSATTTSKMVTSQTTSSTSIAKTKTKTFWDDTKAKHLATFIKEWSKTMNQEYVAATPTNNANYYGISIPNDLSKVTSFVNYQKANFIWSNKGDGEQGGINYQVVAAYTSVPTQTMSMILYLFTLHNNQPEVLVTQTTNGGVLYFRLTANKDLANGFKEIIDGKTPTVKSSSVANSQSTVSTTQPNTYNANTNTQKQYSQSYYSTTQYPNNYYQQTTTPVVK